MNYRLRIVPLSHWLIIALIALGTLLSLPPTRVEARATAAPTSPTTDAATCQPTAWRYRTVAMSVRIPVGAQGVTAQYRYNGCRVEGLWATCSGHSTAFSVARRWCGFYQPTSWNKGKMHIGYNYTVCSSPIPGFGIVGCWDEYLRIQVTKTGAVTYWADSAITAFPSFRFL